MHSKKLLNIHGELTGRDFFNGYVPLKNSGIMVDIVVKRFGQSNNLYQYKFECYQNISFSVELFSDIKEKQFLEITNQQYYSVEYHYVGSSKHGIKYIPKDCVYGEYRVNDYFRELRYIDSKETSISKDEWQKVLYEHMMIGHPSGN